MLREKGNATLLYVSSQAAWHGDPSAAAYCASKAALEGKNIFIFFIFFFIVESIYNSC
jgi:NAD(P)-dependent dehydrogenase (short-subunit alcohol dehydrogenase family)